MDTFAAKIGRKLDNTLGPFLSMNGFQETAVTLHSQNRPVMILMDGADLSVVMEDRITLPELLSRKRQHAARTGEIFLKPTDFFNDGIVFQRKLHCSVGRRLAVCKCRHASFQMVRSV